MASTFTVILTPSDEQVRKIFRPLEHLFDKKANYSIQGLSNAVVDGDKILTEAIKTGGSSIQSASIGSNGLSISYSARSIPNNQGYTSPHPYFSCITLNVSDQGRPTDQLIADALNAFNKVIAKEGLLPGRVVADDQDALGPQTAVLTALQQSAAEQISRTNELFNELTLNFDDRRQQLDEKFADKVAQLEVSHHEKEQQLSKDRAALEELRRELDDRTNTHARRAIRGELITVLQDRQSKFSISKDTTGLRTPIHAVFIILLVSTFLGAAWSLYVWGVNPSDTYGAITVSSLIKSAIFTFGFLTTAGLYVSWMNRWFDKHADAQFQTKQFEIDINRATWAVEAALEWKGIQGEQMPDLLLTGITKHLFEVSPAEQAEYSPLEALASSILGSAANLNLDVNGNKVSLDRKSIREIKKQSD